MEFQVFNPEFVARVWAKRRGNQRTAIPVDAAPKSTRQMLPPISRRALEISEALGAVERRLHKVDLPGRQSAMGIIEETAKRHGVPVLTLFSTRRFPWVAKARMEAMAAIAVARPDLSAKAIGRYFGKDHTTVLHALHKAGIPSRSIDDRKRDLAFQHGRDA